MSAPTYVEPGDDDLEVYRPRHLEDEEATAVIPRVLVNAGFRVQQHRHRAHRVHPEARIALVLLALVLGAASILAGMLWPTL